MRRLAAATGTVLLCACVAPPSMVEVPELDTTTIPGCG